MEILFFALILLGIPFVLPIVVWVSVRRMRARFETLLDVVERQRSELDQLAARVAELRREARVASDVGAAQVVTPAKPTPEPERAPAIRPEPRQAPPMVEKPQTPPPPSVPPVPAIPPTPRVSPAPSGLPTPPVSRPPLASPTPPPPGAPPPPAMHAPASPKRTGMEPSDGGFDWEGLVGVKLFSAIAGIALVVAAVFFLRYSIESGWLQPPVRVAIGIIVAIGLLIACELKAARRYPMTANAMDAAAIAILFSTFFAAHALWNLIPAPVTFALLAVVTAVAVLLSIRRESLFIAVLGLLGGFATPALLSTGENRPIPLFAYLLLLNVGLAWVAYSRRWRVLTWLTLVFTTLYQWGWVFKFLDATSLPLAMGIFLVFPVVAVAGVILRAIGSDDRPDDTPFEQSALVSSMLPLLFSIYLASVPAFGTHAALLFGFLLLIDLGLLAIAVARDEERMHAAGAATTLIVMAVWLGLSYRQSGSSVTALAFTAMFVLLYLLAPLMANRFGRPFRGPARQAQYAGPFLLFVFPVLSRLEPAFVDPWPLAATLLGLVLLVAWRAAASGVGALYYVAAFFAIAMQAVWSVTHLSLERLATAVALYTAFGLVSLIVPLLARRWSRPMLPAWGSGAVLLVSLGLLLFLSLGPVAPAALWALALLLAIMNAGLFVESAAGGLPRVSQVGSVISWIILMIWWSQAAGSVGVLPSLTVVVGLTFVTLAGHGWSVTRFGRVPSASGFGHGLYLGLIGHLFLLLLATDRAWALPPWPVFAALVAITLGTTVTALWSRTPPLHTAGSVAAALVVTAWAAAAGSTTWGLTAVMASGAVSAYALSWLVVADRVGGRRQASATACAVLFVSELSLLVAVQGGATPPFSVLLLAHAANIGVVLALTASERWKYVAIGAVIPAWVAVLQWQTSTDLTITWPQLLLLAGVLYAIFSTYPFLVGEWARDDRDPYLAAILASAMGFFAARAAFLAGQLDWMIGAIPVVEGAVLAVMLRALLRIEPAGQRDLGRLALVAGASLAFVTVAIPMQLRQQWITIGWALEGAAFAWLYRRIPHRGLLYGSVALLGTVFIRLAMNPEVFRYAPRGGMRIFNWYLYTYLICAAALLLAGWWLSRTEDRLAGRLRSSQVLPAAGVILLFMLLNIEIADFYAVGPTIMFRFGATVAQDLTYTIGWLTFGMLLLAAGISLPNRPARVAAVALIAVTTFKCFLYDLGSLEGLHRVASFVGLAISLALVSLALQRFVLSKPRSVA